MEYNLPIQILLELIGGMFMIRVLHIVGAMHRGGIETLLMNIYRNIDRENIQFDFIVHTTEKASYDDEILALGGKIYRIIPRRNGIKKNKRALDTFFKEHTEYKIVHQHVSSLSYIQPLKSAEKAGIPVRIIHSHNTNEIGSPFHRIAHHLNKSSMTSYATHYFACSKAAAMWLYPKNIINNNQFTILNNAVSTRDLRYDEEKREDIRNQLNLKNKLVIGHIGRFTHQKNHEFLIDIFEKLSQKNDNAHLLLVGEGNLKKQITEKVDELGLLDKVTFTGVRSDISDLLQSMDIFVMPSHHEGLPVTLVEAQAAGLPCLLSNAITKEVEITNNIGWLSLNDSPDLWAKKVLEMTDKFIRVDTQEQIIKSKYDINGVSIELQKYYQDLLK
jgi:glycosyltransferase involved in cell wall biosynthesis